MHKAKLFRFPFHLFCANNIRDDKYSIVLVHYTRQFWPSGVPFKDKDPRKRDVHVIFCEASIVRNIRCTRVDCRSTTNPSGRVTAGGYCLLFTSSCLLFLVPHRTDGKCSYFSHPMFTIYRFRFFEVRSVYTFPTWSAGSRPIISLIFTILPSRLNII